MEHNTSNFRELLENNFFQIYLKTYRIAQQVFSLRFLSSFLDKSHSLFSLSFFFLFSRKSLKRSKNDCNGWDGRLLLDAEYLEPVIKFHLANVSEFESSWAEFQRHSIFLSLIFNFLFSSFFLFTNSLCTDIKRYLTQFHRNSECSSFQIVLSLFRGIKKRNPFIYPFHILFKRTSSSPFQ